MWQVLARFEDFPSKKLEAIRMSAALHLKLDAIVTTLQNWQIVAPVGKLLDKAEGYFNKVSLKHDPEVARGSTSTPNQFCFFKTSCLVFFFQKWEYFSALVTENLLPVNCDLLFI